MRQWTAALAAGFTVSLAVLSGQEATLTIRAPAAGDYVSDRVRIEVRVEPAEWAGEVRLYTFFADGREVCRVEAPSPAICHWDAGSVVRAHQLRVVASLADGRRLVASRRTGALDVVKTAVRVVQVGAPRSTM